MKAEDATEALLEGLIAECHALIRNEIIPAGRDDEYRGHIHSQIDDTRTMMDMAVKLADAIGRLRRPEPPPELRQRITVEKIQSPVQRLSPPAGPAEGGQGGGDRQSG